HVVSRIREGDSFALCGLVMSDYFIGTTGLAQILDLLIEPCFKCLQSQELIC
ncbi:hypothetical protein HAX54_050037, partial [Datura stramonium]|nr:hypothetical protein [Datura stramonium]